MINTEFKSLSEIAETFPDEASCIKHLEELRWNGFVVSPFDPASKVYRCNGNKYKCKKSGKYFNAKTGTVFHDSKVALSKWFAAIWLVTENRKNITSIELGKELDITQKTAWYMIKRIKSYYQLEKEPSSKVKKKAYTKIKPEIEKPIKIIVEEKLEMIDWLKLMQLKK